MQNFTRRQRINVALALTSAGGIVSDSVPYPDGQKYCDAAGQVAWLAGEDDVNVQAAIPHLDLIRSAVPLVGGMDINVIEKLRTVETILGLPLTPMKPMPPSKVPGMMRGFPRLQVPLPKSKPAAGSEQPDKPPAPVEAVMHDCRPVDHVKPPPRRVPIMTTGQVPQRPENPTLPPPVSDRPRPSFLRPLRGSAAAPAQHVSSGVVGEVTTHPPAVTVRAPAPPVVIRYDKHGRPTLSPEDIPFD